MKGLSSLTKIDPLLYRSHETELEKKAQRLADQNKKGKNEFGKQLKSTIAKQHSLSLSSDILSKNLSKAQIKAHIGTNLGRQKLYEAAEQFEAFFLEKMYKEMKKNVGKSMMHRGFAEDVFDEMLLQERVGKIAHQGEFGLAEKMYQQLLRI